MGADRRVRPNWTLVIFSISLLALAVLWAAITGGGDSRFDSGVVLLLVGLAGLAGVPALARDTSRPRDGLLTAAAILLPAYVAFQLIPLPAAILHLLSPARADLAAAVAQVTGASTFAPVTVSTPTSWHALARVAGCTIVFLLVRAAARTPRQRWLAVMPLVIVVAAVAGAAFLAGPGEHGFTAGSYANRNHFANLNAVVLPLALGSALVALNRAQHKGNGTVLMAAIPLVAAATMLVAVLFSWSKGGTLALLASLTAMAAVGGGSRLSTRARIGLSIATAVTLVAFVFFLTPGGLVQRFAVVTTNDPTEGRVPVWVDTLRLIAAYPLVGVGLGSYFPAIMPFQTYGLELAWINAHNDYLQVAAELGLLGASIPVCIIGVALWRALRTAMTQPLPEGQFLGLACAAALAAFLVHSISEFNSYVFSNALALSWVAGAAASLTVTDWTPYHGPRRQPARGFIVVPVVIGLALLSIASSVGWFVYLRSYQDDPAAERAFCGWGICDSDSAIDTLRAGDDPQIAYPVPVADMAIYLRRDPAAPYRWADLGESLAIDGRTADARFAFEQAVRLAPRDPGTLLTAADFRFEAGERAQALDLVARALHAGVDVDQAAFGLLDYRKVPIESRLGTLPDGRAAQAFFEWLLAAHEPALDQVNDTWSFLLARHYATDRLASRFVDFMLSKREPAAAAHGWVQYLAAVDRGYRSGDAIFNESFEGEPIGSRFDWRLARLDGVTVDFDETEHADARRSLRLRFAGTKNLHDLGVHQDVFAPAGRYRFRALVRTSEVTTDQGLRFRIVSELEPGVNVETDQLRGTTGWSPLEAMVDVPAPGALLRVSLVRTASLKFDSDIKGTAWVDAVTLERVE